MLLYWLLFQAVVMAIKNVDNVSRHEAERRYAAGVNYTAEEEEQMSGEET